MAGISAMASSTRLPADILRKLLDCVRQLHATTPLFALYARCLESLKSLIHHDHGFIQAFDPNKAGRPALTLTHCPSNSLRIYERWTSEDRAWRKYLENPGLRAYRKVRTFGVPPLACCGATHPPRQMHVLGIANRPPGDVSYAITLFRRGEIRGFDARDEKILCLFRPHWEIALRNALTLNQLQGHAEVLEGVMNASQRHLVVVTERGDIRYATASALRMLGRAANCSDPHPQLPWMWRLAPSLLQRLRQSGGQGWLAVHDPGRGKSKLKIHTTPLHGRDKLYLLEISEAVSETGLESLSPREQEVARAIALGLRNHEIAETLFIREGTVKKMLANIFRKTCLASRAELAAAVLEEGRMV